MTRPEIGMHTVAVTLVDSGKVQVNAGGEQHEIRRCGIYLILLCLGTVILTYNDRTVTHLHIKWGVALGPIVVGAGTRHLPLPEYMPP